MKPIKRLEHYREIQKISFKEFEQSIGFAKNAYRTALDRGSGLSSSTIQKILENHPRLNLLWILTGEGDIVNGESGIASNTEKTYSFGEPNLLHMYDMIDQLIQNPNESDLKHLKRELVRLFSLYSGLKSELYEIKKLSDQLN